jgi:capsular polysaccharide biosynthesis protein
VIDEQCGKVEGCRWTTMWVAKMTYCEQVQSMMETDVLVSVHSAQMTNMIFMSPGGRVLEMFSKGWFEIAGRPHSNYTLLANWNGLRHEGY